MKIDFHVHPHFKNYNSKAVVDAMSARKVDILGLAGYNKDTFDENRRIFDELEERYGEKYSVENDNLIIKIKDKSINKKYSILRVGEYNNKEGFHLLVFGNQKGIKEGSPIEENIEAALSTDSFVVLDHPFIAQHCAEKRKGGIVDRTLSLLLDYADIDKKKEDFLFRVCEKYSGNIAIEWNGYPIPSLRNVIDKSLQPLRLLRIEEIRFEDINKKVESLEEKLRKGGKNCPLVADTDLHAPYKKDLLLIGTANIKADVDVESGSVLQKSLKEKIFFHDYEINKGYVPISHFIISYAFPVLLGNLSKTLKERIRPRG